MLCAELLLGSCFIYTVIVVECHVGHDPVPEKNIIVSEILTAKNISFLPNPEAHKFFFGIFEKENCATKPNTIIFSGH